jgi:hypothetical protein
MLFCTPAFAQSQKQLERKARIDSSYQRYAQSKLTVKLNLLSLFDPETPTVQTGAEYRISNKVSAELTFGIPVPLHGSTRVIINCGPKCDFFLLSARLFTWPRN